MRRPLRQIDAVPSKRVYLSIIADYDLNRSICELVDNAIDSWNKHRPSESLLIEIDLDCQQQSITVKDNAGGIPEEEISVIVSPGGSKNQEGDQTIGIFGVGSKRAVVAMSQLIRIYSRHSQGKTVLVEVDDEWLNADTWNLDVYEDSYQLKESCTEIQLSKLRSPINEEEEETLRTHLEEVYGKMVQAGDVRILLNEEAVAPRHFEKWSFPPDYEPTSHSDVTSFKRKDGTEGEVFVEMMAGLTKSGEPSDGEFGVYFYCNNRLVAKAMKSYDVGFTKGKIGNPHPTQGLARVIVYLEGSASLMPWNSSKSEIDTKHPVFKAIQPHIIEVMDTYAKLSKRLSAQEGGWPENVFKHPEGKIKTVDFKVSEKPTKLHTPPVPRAHREKIEVSLTRKNAKLASQKPWVIGIYEVAAAFHAISKLQIQQKNRILLLLLDSGLEIAFKEYLQNESSQSYSEDRLKNIMKNRHEVHKEVKSSKSFTQAEWKKVDYYYTKRSEIVHKRASVAIPDGEIQDFKALYEHITTELFGLDFT